MKIALINGSPKVKNSTSEYILKTLKAQLPKGHEIIEHHFRISTVGNIDLEQLTDCDALVFAFPLYVDGLPSHLIKTLYEMEKLLKGRPTKKTTVYSLVNSGFYEGHQNAIALDIMKNWSEKARLSWGQGLGIGGGGMLLQMAGMPEGQGPKKNFGEALKVMANNIATDTSADNLFISPNFPRFAYKLAAEMGWRQQGKANGLKAGDLFKQL